MRFLGNIEAKLDAKGRVFLPAQFRKVLANGTGGQALIVRKDVFQDCLVIYPEDVWNEQMDALRLRLNRWNKQHQQVFRQYVSDVEEIQLDANGRFLLSKRCKAMAGIDRELRFIGMGDTIEIWAEEKAAKPFVEPDQLGQALEQIMTTEEE